MLEAEASTAHWRGGGPIFRAPVGTVREDYSPDGTPGTTSRRSRALAGLPLGRGRDRRDLRDHLSGSASALALWNERDPILKERLFGLTRAAGQSRRGREGVLLPRRHADPFLHEVPLQVSAGRLSLRALVEENAGRPEEPEFELVDTGVFDASRYFDVDRGIRQGRHRRRPDAAHRIQPRPRFRPAPPGFPGHRVILVARSASRCVRLGGARPRTRCGRSARPVISRQRPHGNRQLARRSRLAQVVRPE